MILQDRRRSKKIDFEREIETGKLKAERERDVKINLIVSELLFTCSFGSTAAKA